MNKHLIKAREKLDNDNLTLVLFDGKEYITSTSRGVYFLLSLYDSNVDYSHFVAADKVIGKGAAFIYVLLKIKHIYVKVISKSALEILLSYNIDVNYDLLVENIINHEKTGICYIEETCLNIINPFIAISAIRKKLKELKEKQND